uniref:C3H1-type domain-containing protein n=1 Tax=Acrobeloides nanus TaxID=290746 RepID=A0A914D555_9BILA
MFCDKGVKERLVFGIPLLQWLKLSDAEREAHKRNMRKSSCFRTRLCRAFQKGFCPYGQLCNFAHGEEELHNPPPLHPKYKTMLCRNFVHGICPYGDRCQFIHNKTGVSMDSGFAYSQNFSQSLASASNPVHHRAPFAASNRYSFNHSMMAGSTTSYNMPSMNHNNYRSTMETFRMGLQENGSPIDTT